MLTVWDKHNNVTSVSLPERGAVRRSAESARYAIDVRGPVEAGDHVRKEPWSIGVSDAAVFRIDREHVDSIDGRGQQLAHLLNVLRASVCLAHGPDIGDVSETGRASTEGDDPLACG